MSYLICSSCLRGRELFGVCVVVVDDMALDLMLKHAHGPQCQDMRIETESETTPQTRAYTLP